MKNNSKKKKNKNQISFYFEDYIETNKKNKILKKTNNIQDRMYLLFFFFFSLILIFSISWIGSSGKFNLNLIKKFLLSLTNFGSIAAWKVFIFLEIITPFLSTISLLIKVNCDEYFSLLKIFFWSRDI